MLPADPPPSGRHAPSTSLRLLVLLVSLGLMAGCASGETGPADPPPPGSGGGSAGDDDDGSPDDDDDTADDDDDATCEARPLEVVQLETDDGVTLEADLVVAGQAGGPGVVLLHMIPPSNDRTGYPRGFLDTLAEAGITVLNVDRRGAGGSGGRAVDAYRGPSGKLDAVAAVRFLLAHPCAPDPDRIGFVGASNGTTTVLDYTVHAAATDGLPVPSGIAFLSGGAYTEEQHRIGDHLETLSTLPLLFAYPTAEAGWNDGHAARGVASWRFEAFSPGAHGTRLFGTDAAAVTALLRDHLTTALGD